MKNTSRIISIVSMILVTIISIAMIVTASKYSVWVAKDSNSIAMVEQELRPWGGNTYVQANVDYMPIERNELCMMVVCTYFMAAVGVGSVACQSIYYGIKGFEYLTKKDNKIKIGKSA